MICRAFDDDLSQILKADREELAAVDGIGPVLAEAFAAFFESEKNRRSLEHVLEFVTIQKEERDGEQPLSGQVFVITGSLQRFAGRSQLKAYIEQRGGKVTGSVTGKTTFLINNDSTSQSSKNKKARETGVPILTEDDFLARLKEGTLTAEGKD